MRKSVKLKFHESKPNLPGEISPLVKQLRNKLYSQLRLPDDVVFPGDPSPTANRITFVSALAQDERTIKKSETANSGPLALKPRTTNYIETLLNTYKNVLGFINVYMVKITDCRAWMKNWLAI